MSEEIEETMDETSYNMEMLEASALNMDFHTLKDNNKLIIEVDPFLNYSEEAKNEKKGVGDGQKYECSLCSKKYKVKLNLERHIIKEHTDKEKLNKCDMCEKVFSTPGSLSNHKIVVHSADKGYICDICGKIYQHKKKLKRHQLVHMNQDEHICEVCGKGYPVVSKLIHHMFSHTGHNTIDCPICKKKISVTTIYRHMAFHSGDRPHICQYCGKSYIQKHTLVEHLLSHTGEKRQECDICGKRFVHRSTLRNHKYTHGPRRFKCDSCGKTFHFYTDYNKHRKENCLAPRPICLHCNKSFWAKSALIRHMKRQHIGINEFQCQICDKWVARLDNFKNHMKIHGKIVLNNSNHVCSVCCKSFLFVDDLNVHSEIFHQTTNIEESGNVGNILDQAFGPTEETVYNKADIPYICEICCDIFIDKQSLIQHIKVHTTNVEPHKNDRTYVNGKKIKHNNRGMRFMCEFCNVRFNDEKILDKHRLTHMTDSNETDEHDLYFDDQYICMLCPKTFVNKLSLEKHVETHDTPNKKLPVIVPTTKPYSSNKYYNCHICKKKFINQISCDKHMEMHSKISNNSDSDDSAPRNKRNAKNKVNGTFYICKICNKEYANLSNFEKHVVNAHLDELEKIEKEFKNTEKKPTNCRYMNHTTKKCHKHENCNKGSINKKMIVQKNLGDNNLTKSVINVPKNFIPQQIIQMGNKLIVPSIIQETTTEKKCTEHENCKHVILLVPPKNVLQQNILQSNVITNTTPKSSQNIKNASNLPQITNVYTISDSNESDTETTENPVNSNLQNNCQTTKMCNNNQTSRDTSKVDKNSAEKLADESNNTLKTTNLNNQVVDNVEIEIADELNFDQNTVEDSRSNAKESNFDLSTVDHADMSNFDLNDAERSKSDRESADEFNFDLNTAEQSKSNVENADENNFDVNTVERSKRDCESADESNSDYDSIAYSNFDPNPVDGSDSDCESADETHFDVDDTDQSKNDCENADESNFDLDPDEKSKSDCEIGDDLDTTVQIEGNFENFVESPLGLNADERSKSYRLNANESNFVKSTSDRESNFNLNAADRSKSVSETAEDSNVNSNTERSNINNESALESKFEKIENELKKLIENCNFDSDTDIKSENRKNKNSKSCEKCLKEFKFMKDYSIHIGICHKGAKKLKESTKKSTVTKNKQKNVTLLASPTKQQNTSNINKNNLVSILLPNSTQKNVVNIDNLNKMTSNILKVTPSQNNPSNTNNLMLLVSPTVQNPVQPQQKKNMVMYQPNAVNTNNIMLLVLPNAQQKKEEPMQLLLVQMNSNSPTNTIINQPKLLLLSTPNSSNVKKQKMILPRIENSAFNVNKNTATQQIGTQQHTKWLTNKLENRAYVRINDSYVPLKPKLSAQYPKGKRQGELNKQPNTPKKVYVKDGKIIGSKKSVPGLVSYTSSGTRKINDKSCVALEEPQKSRKRKREEEIIEKTCVRYVCNYCYKFFDTKIILQEHIENICQKTDKEHECHFCKDKFMHENALRVHLKVHNEINKIKPKSVDIEQ